MPIFFEPDCMLTSKSAIQKSGINLDNCKSFEGYVNELNKFIANSNGKQKISKYTYEPSVFYKYMNELYDYENSAVNIDTDEFKDIISKYKNVYKSIPDPQIGNMFKDAIKNLVENETIFEDGLSLFEKASVLITYDTPIIVPNYTTDSKIKVNVKYCVAIISTCKNKKAAYNFIKELMSPETQNDGKRKFNANPILKFSMRNYIDNNKSMIERYVNKEFISCSEYDFSKLSEQFYEHYMNLFKKPMDATFSTKAVNMLNEYIEPYFKDEKSLDECVNKAQQQLEIYISE